MVRYSAKVPINFELPAPVCVCALLIAGALAKGDHPQWAIGATILLGRTALGGAVRKTWHQFRPRARAANRCRMNGSMAVPGLAPLCHSNRAARLRFGGIKITYLLVFHAPA